MAAAQAAVPSVGPRVAGPRSPNIVYGPIPYKSPHRYVESEVTIHYRSPVRAEAKEALSEEELARRQAEAMRRIYQEERRRKYLQELQDMHSRRHTDNFTPSQKSPIPLNRYDDFLDDVTTKSRPRDKTPEPKLVARALYNFVGQTSRELSFRRGDIIFVRRQIDKNWYEGEHNAMVGLFPLNYVEIIPYDGIRTMPKKPTEGQARAKFNFIAQTHLELSLVKGELVVLTRRVDENWYEGRIGNRKGIFPVSYVEVLQEPGDNRTGTLPTPTKTSSTPTVQSVLVNGTGVKSYQQPGSTYYSQNKATSSYTSSSPYATLPRQAQPPKQPVAPVSQTLHIDTHSEPVPYKALYNYRPQNEDELELREGDTVYVMEKCDDGCPSQKLPIQQNCYGDFLPDDTTKSRPGDKTPEPKLVARALYNFVGRTLRELSFRQGDIIFVRKQIDKNWYEGEHNAAVGLFPLNYVEIIPYDGIQTMPKKPTEGQARAKFNFPAQTHLELSLVKGELVVLTRRVDENWYEGRIGNRKGIFPVSYVEVLQESGDSRTGTLPMPTKTLNTPTVQTVLVNGMGVKSYQQPGSTYYSQNKATSSYTSSSPYSTLPRQAQPPKQPVAPVNRKLHNNTHLEPVPYKALYNYRPQNEDELELREGDTVYVMGKCDDGWYVGSSQRTGFFGIFPGNYVERL